MTSYYEVNYWTGDYYEIIYRTLSKSKAESVCKQANDFLGYKEYYEVMEFELEDHVYKINHQYHNVPSDKWYDDKEINNKPETSFNMHRLIKAEEIKP